MRRAFLIVSAVIAALAVVPAATADKPTREILSGLEDFVVTDQCEFPVLVHTEGGGIAMTFTDKEGDVVKELLVFPANKQVFTNLDTGTSVTVVTTGPGHFHFNPDGSGFLKVTGHSAWLADPVTGEPGIFLTEGRFLLTFDAEGTPTSVDLTGHRVDVCAQLAS
jgi:hypothetical protein